MRRSTGLFARLALVHVPVLVLVTAFASSCASQAEGERCDPRNGSDDCESGLKCVKLSELNTAETDSNVGICCPTSSTQASDVCSQSSYTPAPEGGTAAGGASGTGGAASGGASSAGGASSGGASAGGASASGGAPDAGAGGASAGGASASGGAPDAGAIPDASGD